MEVRRLAADEVVEAAQTLADAFDGYPWTAWTVAADRHRERLTGLFALTVEAVGLPYGDVWAAVEPTGRIAAVAVWLGPDRPVPARVWTDLAARNAELAGDRHEVALVAEVACAPLRATDPAYLLATVGVRRDRWGGGFGSRVLRPGLADAARAGLPVVLETSAERNVGFYRRLGFEVTGEVRVPDGGPKVWGMRRAPAT
ncbi:GNAT family N-acetyltransferase [Micromonospora sp. NPDC049900]|uniref:GNAT family N-acetyltransferase n=1 Tax=unclassified Micromonospora TaxID=2617518 RepID=UPI0037BCFB59